jgi:hypothetical protein
MKLLNQTGSDLSITGGKNNDTNKAHREIDVVHPAPMSHGTFLAEGLRQGSLLHSHRDVDGRSIRSTYVTRA